MNWKISLMKSTMKLFHQGFQHYLLYQIHVPTKQYDGYMAYAFFGGGFYNPHPPKTANENVTQYDAGCQSPRRMTWLSSCWPFTFDCCCEGAAPRNTFNPRTTFCAMIFMILVHLASCCSQRLHGITYAISRGVYLKIKAPLRQIHLSFSAKLVCF